MSKAARTLISVVAAIAVTQGLLEALVLPYVGQWSQHAGHPLWSGFNINHFYVRAYAWFLVSLIVSLKVAFPKSIIPACNNEILRFAQDKFSRPLDSHGRQNITSGWRETAFVTKSHRVERDKEKSTKARRRGRRATLRTFFDFDEIAADAMRLQLKWVSRQPLTTEGIVVGAGIAGFAAYGLELQIPFFAAYALFAGGYVLAVLGLARITGWSLARFSNAGLCLAPLVLLAISHATRLKLDSGVLACPWVSVKAAIALSVCCFMLWTFWSRIFRDSRRDSRRDSGRDSRRDSGNHPVLIFIGIPLLLFLMHASVPAQIPKINADFHHAGESLVPAQWILRGWFPWRDITFHHGLLANPIRSWVGLFAVNQSWWGAEAGERLILIPLGMIFAYLLRVRMYGGHFSYLMIATFILPLLLPQVFGRRVAYYERLLPYPLFLCLLSYAWESNRALALSATGAFLVLFILVTPEAALLAAAVGIVIAMRAILARLSGLSMMPQARECFFLAVGGLASAIPIVLFLKSNGALGPFLDFFRYTLSGYRFVYGMAMQPQGIPAFWALLAISYGVFCLTCWRVCRGFLERRDLTVTEWVLVVIGVFTPLYFQKFLAEADDHLYAVVFVTLPLLEYLGFQVWFRARPKKWLVVSAGIAAGVLLLLSPSVKKVVASLQRFESKFVTDGAGAYLSAPGGWVTASREERKIIDDFRTLFERTLQPDDAIFDMTNSSQLFHYLLDRRFVGRYPQTITVASIAGQKDAIESLIRHRPKVVIYDRAFGFNVSLPVPTPVRFYAISKHVLEEYTPWMNLNGYSILHRKDWTPPQLGRGFKQFTENRIASSIVSTSCDWGAIPHYWARTDTIASSDASSEPLPFQESQDAFGYVAKIELPERLRWNSKVLEIEIAEGAPDSWVITDSAEPESPRSPSSPSFRISFVSRKGAVRVYRIPVSSCLQWREFSGNALFIRHRFAQQILAVRVE